MNTNESDRRQSGAALVVGLIMLLIVTLIGFGSIRSSVMELRMANNAAIKNEAFHQAQAGLDYLLAHPELLPVRGAMGYSYCTQSVSAGRALCRIDPDDCREYTVDLPKPLKDGPEKEGPERATSALQMTLGAGGVPRGFATSGRLFDAVSFTAQSCYDDTEHGRGNSAINVGVVILTPKL